MSQIVEGGVIVILASPVGTTFKAQWGNQIYPTRLKVWKTYVGRSHEYETMNAHPGSSCSLTFPTHQTSLIIAKRNKDGILETGICSGGGFSKNQWMTYFETGIESPPKDRCYMKIKQAYDSEVFLGKFTLEDPKCKVHIPDYDAKFRATR